MSAPKPLTREQRRAAAIRRAARKARLARIKARAEQVTWAPAMGMVDSLPFLPDSAPDSAPDSPAGLNAPAIPCPACGGPCAGALNGLWCVVCGACAFPYF